MSLLHEPTDSYSISTQETHVDPSKKIESTKSLIFHLFTQVDQELGWPVQLAFRLQDVDLRGNDIRITFEEDAKKLILRNSDSRDTFISIVKKHFIPQYGNITFNEKTCELLLFNG